MDYKGTNQINDYFIIALSGHVWTTKLRHGIDSENSIVIIQNLIVIICVQSILHITRVRFNMDFNFKNISRFDSIIFGILKSTRISINLHFAFR